MGGVSGRMLATQSAACVPVHVWSMWTHKGWEAAVRSAAMHECMSLRETRVCSSARAS